MNIGRLVIDDTWVSSKFAKSWTLEIQILKYAVYLQNITDFKIKR